MRWYCLRRKNGLDEQEWRIRQLVRHYVIVAAATGMRVGEQRQLRWKDIDGHMLMTEQRSVFSMVTITVRAATSKVRTTRRFQSREGEIFSRLKRMLKPASEDALVFTWTARRRLVNEPCWPLPRMLKARTGWLRGTRHRTVQPAATSSPRDHERPSYRQIADMCGTCRSDREDLLPHQRGHHDHQCPADYRFDQNGLVSPP